ncbi:PAS domain S-box-containing protein/diguanylate cyclase (GGDEF) domain-containing protein [Methylobacterium phyllostachyos]|uniref:PAS domain S-box-containing protein/diguanylate cyclase (GGDEF) domain-containing protein n=1 Tax=Methylobacterium phyllostachyos TaxID=582672 RepID=A0A1H0CBH9_9HYPH|nr:EAL domain-containing protein [Methylobacterium phyllostachyos]SDN55225.1 PAS domain S-box-containing protein/diguanylate cyclase (GGDEF) domain-containing protein [Methylobacterium phyllostachyos]
MSIPALNADEEARLQALAELDMLDAEPDATISYMVEITARVLGTPTAFASFLDRDRQVFHARFGLDLDETARSIALCDWTIRQDAPFVVCDTQRDVRFCDNPLVLGPPFIRFYAGVALRTRAGHAVGTLCVTAPEPRAAFTDQDQQILSDFARFMSGQIELRRAEAGRRAFQARFERIADTSPDAIVCADAQGLVRFWSAGAERMFGHTGPQILGQPIATLIPDRMAGGSEGLLRRLAHGSAERLTGRTVELTAEHRDGREFPVELSLSTWHENGQPAYGAIMRDVSQRWAIEERLFRLAHLDPLTELPNRLVLRGRIEAALTQAEPAAVLMFDLDGFKEVNDAHGHAVGDAVLKMTAERLRACAGLDGTAARFGGDEFAIVLPGLGDPLMAVAAAEAALRVLAEPYRIDGLVMHLGASAGIALSPSHATEEGELLACADAALYDAKARGRGQHRLFTPELREALQRERACREGLRRAVLREEFVLHYQPQVRLSDGALVGAEALIRWQHPEHGLMPPAAFLDVLDNSPDAAGIGDWVLRTACAQAQAWRARGLHPFRIGVNLFAAQFRGGDLAARVATVLAQTGLPPEALELEITETIILRHDPQVDTALQALRTMGVGIAFDDYGTGYASLSLLKNFPLTRLKIDRGFVNGLCEDPRDAAIVRAVIALGRSFGLTVIAEGVETQEQQRRLLAKGCQEAQGYLFGRPMAAEDFAARYGLAGQAASPVTRAGSAG